MNPVNDEQADSAATDGPGTATDHYFTARPASADERRTIRVRLAGEDHEVQTAAGVFQPAGVDRGTQVLLDHVPEPPASGDLLDLGCGWGPLALTLGLLSPDARVWAIDVNERALDLTRRNATALGVRVQACVPAEVPAGIAFDTIWSNPPIRVGKAALHELLRTWLPRLTVGGQAHLVVAKSLGSDSLATWLQAELDGLAGEGAYEVTRETTKKGFRVLRVHRVR